MCSLSNSRLENWLRVHLLSCLSLQDEATKYAITINVFPSHRKYSWISASVFIFCVFSVRSNPQLVVADGHSQCAWFCWRFLPVKREFFLSAVDTCMLSMRDCCKVNASDCSLSLHAHPGRVTATSH
ncbi:hypothetical protein ILYODFUR_008816 [Ilyodon furcidens]|uniref:Secreted protein n=1 Tax=Ilyodon furcidens TaxID=33524 RepID=A0ABV0SVC1_9TELE